MKLGAAFSAIFLASKTFQAEASSPMVAGFEPTTNIQSPLQLDLDQKDVASYSSAEVTFPESKDMYEKGGNSGSYAELTITGGLPFDIPAGQQIAGTAVDGRIITGTTMEAATAGAGTLMVSYDVADDPIISEFGCKVGALTTPLTAACFNATGAITAGSNPNTISYSYDVFDDNKNDITIQKFSLTAADSYVDSSGNPLPTFQKFLNYYGTPTYCDEWVQAAYSKGETSFTNGNGYFQGKDESGLSQAIKKGTAYQCIAMQVFSELEKAVDQCKPGNNDMAVASLDLSVAYYVGSAEGAAPGGSGNGYLQYILANKRSKQFGTSLPPDKFAGPSEANEVIMREYSKISDDLTGLDTDCALVEAAASKIMSWMTVPFSQAIQRYAWMNEYEDSTDKKKVEGAAFAAAILPFYYDCDPAVAETIYKNLASNSGTPNFVEMKEAMETCYSYLGINCAVVGGYYNTGTGEYRENAAPCEDPEPSSASTMALSASVAVVAALALLL